MTRRRKAARPLATLLEPPGPLANLLGIRPATLDDGRAVFTIALGRDHLNPYGAVHGGVVYSLVDTAMGAALVSKLKAGERCATLEIKINYLASATEGALRAEARVVDRRRRIGVLEAQVRAEDGRLVALATGSFYIQAAR